VGLVDPPEEMEDRVAAAQVVLLILVEVLVDLALVVDQQMVVHLAVHPEARVAAVIPAAGSHQALPQCTTQNQPALHSLEAVC